jgi:hypothetical protein
MSKKTYYLIVANFDRGNFMKSDLYKKLKIKKKYTLGDLKLSDNFILLYNDSCLKEIFSKFLKDNNILSEIEKIFPDYVITINDKKELNTQGKENLEKIITHSDIKELETNIILWQFNNNENIFVINSKDLYINDKETKKKLPDILYYLLKTQIENDYKLRLFIHDKEYGKETDIYDIYNKEIEIITFMHEKSSSDVFTNLTASYNNHTEFKNKLNEIFDNFGISKLKTKLINTFLPLAIDMQGLIEVSNNNEGKFQKYLLEVIEKLDEQLKDIPDKCNKIKKVLSENHNFEIDFQGFNNVIKLKEIFNNFPNGKTENTIQKWLENELQEIDNCMNEQNI